MLRLKVQKFQQTDTHMEQLLSPPRLQPVTRASQRPAAAAGVSTLARVARIAGFDARNRVLVEVPGLAGTKRARLLKGIRRQDLMESDGPGREVLVVFDGDCPECPIIVGLLQHETGQSADTTAPDASAKTGWSKSAEAHVLVEALAELVLKCGASSITLRKDGKVVLRGTHLLSRSSGPVRIKGGHVEIN